MEAAQFDTLSVSAESTLKNDHMVMDLMKTAEGMFEKGADRKEWVLAMIKGSADSINYDIDIEAISQLIDSLCDMSKVVNNSEAPTETPAE